MLLRKFIAQPSLVSETTRPTRASREPAARLLLALPVRIASWVSVGFAVSLTSPGCHLDANDKTACDSAEDCLGGYVCADHECVVAGKSGSDGSLSAPTDVTGSFDAGTLEYRLSWRDKSEDETGFEIEQMYEDSTMLDAVALTSPRPVPANVRVAAYYFDREGTFTFRVRAVRGGEMSAYSAPHVRTVSDNEQYPWDAAKVPTTPQAEYSFVESTDGYSGSVELRWSPADFRGDEISLTGYRVYRRHAYVPPWELLRVLPTSIQSYQDSREDGGMMDFEYAIAAFNRFGESRRWTYSEDDAL